MYIKLLTTFVYLLISAPTTKYINSMRVVIDARESGTSTGRYVDKLVENLHDLKTDIDFVILTKLSRVAFFQKNTPRFEVIESKYKEFTFGEQYGLVWQLYGLRADLVHFAMTQQPVLYFGDCVTTIHDLTTARFRNPAKNRLIFGFKQIVYRWVIKRVSRKSKAIITPSEFVKNDIAKFAKIPKNKIHLTYEAADKITTPPVPTNKLLSTNYLLYIGRPQPHKNLWRLVEAFELLRQARPELKLVLVGKKDVLYERLEKKTIKKGISGVVFTDFVSEGQLRWLYENTAAYVFPSLSEGFGLPGLEAMAHGAPVVSSNATCLPEVYGQAAHYFDPLDPKDMASKIGEVLSDGKLRAKLIANGYKQAAKYSWAEMATQTIDVYRRLLSE